MARRGLVTLPSGVWTVIDKELKGVIGDGDSEIIRNIVIGFLTEKGYLLNKMPANKESIGRALDKLEISNAALITVLNSVMTPKDSFYDAYTSEVDKMLENQT